MSKKSDRERAEMDRIRAARGLPPLRDTRQLMFEQVAAARCYASSITSSEHQQRVELSAFMSIFHPEVDAETLRSMLT